MAVTIEKLDAAIIEAKRFVDAASAAKKALKEKSDKYGSWCPKETGKVRRASMDLTRSLVDIRR